MLDRDKPNRLQQGTVCFMFIYIEKGAIFLKLHRDLSSGKGGGYSWEFLAGVCRPVLQILTPYRTKKCHFSQPLKSALVVTDID